MSLSFGHVLLSKVYGLAWRLARPVLRRHRRLADGFSRRLVPEDWAEPADVWVQVASGGEAYLVRELLARTAELPGTDGTDGPLRVLVTTWTRQGLEVLQGMVSDYATAFPNLHIRIALFPLDQPSLMFRAVRMVSPRLLVLLETELWPGLLLACTRRRVPVLVLNGRLTPKSLRGFRILDRLAPGFWEAVGPCRAAAVSAADAQRYAALLGAERTLVLPNIKFDRALPPVAERTADRDGPANLLPAGTGRVLLASVREQEEAVLLPAVMRLHAAGAAVIVAPRHLHRIAAWKQRLGAAGLPCRLRSSCSAAHPARQGEVLLWDAFGELSALYGAADAVFVGGSLAPLGGQNFLEPLAAGRIPCTGPYLDNFAWALEATDVALEPGEDGRALRDAGLIEICDDVGLVAERLLQRLHRLEPPAEVAARFRAWIAPRKGGAAAGAALMAEHLHPASPSAPGR